MITKHDDDIMEKRKAVWGRMEDILDQAANAGRNLSAKEAAKYDELEAELDGLTGTMDRGKRHAERKAELEKPIVDYRLLPGGDTTPRNDSATHWIDQKTGEEVRSLSVSERMSDHIPESRDYSDRSFGRYIRGKLTGDWTGADEERAMSVGTDSSGGFLVPNPLSSRVLDLARNQTRVFQAGAQTIPMSAQTLTIAKITDDPAAGWRAENASVDEDDLTLGSVDFDAKALAVIVRLSRELFDDAPNVDDVITQTVARAIAVELDRVALYGSGTDPEPEGVRNNSSLTLVDMAENGAALTDYSEILDAMHNVWSNNYQANAMIMAPRSRRDLAKLQDTTNQPLRAPEDVAALRRLDTAQVPVDQTHGTASDATDILLGDWRQLLVGMRQNLRIQLLSERYSDNLQVGFLCYLRADVQVAEINAFSGVEGIIPPS